MDNPTQPTPERVELMLRANRRSLMVVLVLILLAGATFIAHAVRPGSLLADWLSRAPWLIPVVIVLFAVPAGMARRRPAAPADARVLIETVLDDEFRQANLARAQRLALVVVLLAQIPLMALSLSHLAVWAVVTVMAVTTVMVGTVTLIASFLFFDRE